MDREQTARLLILQYLEQSAVKSAEMAEELGVAADCLRNVWGVDPQAIPQLPVKSILDLIPAMKYDTERAMKLKVEGNEALGLGNLEQALAKYTEAIVVDPTQPTFYCNRAAVYSKLDQFAEAIEDCEKAISFDSAYANAYSRLGFAHFKLNNTEAARSAYERGLRACPDNAALKNNLESLGPAPSAAPPAGGMPDLSSLMGLMGGMGGMGAVMEKLEAEFASDPDMVSLIDEIKANPMSILQRMGDPRVQRLMGSVMGAMQGRGA